MRKNIKIAEKSSASALVRSHITFAHTVVEEDDTHVVRSIISFLKAKMVGKKRKIPDCTYPRGEVDLLRCES